MACPECGADVDITYSIEPDESELVRELTAIVREVDIDFQAAGGSSRHWVRDHFLPEVRSHGYRIVKLPQPQEGTQQ